MRITPGRYKEEHAWKNYITFASETDQHISLVFLWRLAAFCKDFRVKSALTIGFRDEATQKRLYDLYLSGKGNPAAPPGSSWHEASCAIDMRDAAEGGWFHRFSDVWLMPYSALKQGLNAYGLTAPLNKSDKVLSQVEWWHWQPIETSGYVGNRMTFLQPDDAICGKPDTVRLGDRGVWVTELQWLLNRMQTGVFDIGLEIAVKGFQKSAGLIQDGICGSKTFKALYR